MKAAGTLTELSGRLKKAEYLNEKTEQKQTKHLIIMKTTNNKGFTLIELLVVIAIIGITANPSES